MTGKKKKFTICGHCMPARHTREIKFQNHCRFWGRGDGVLSVKGAGGTTAHQKKPKQAAPRLLASINVIKNLRGVLGTGFVPVPSRQFA